MILGWGNNFSEHINSIGFQLPEFADAFFEKETNDKTNYKGFTYKDDRFQVGGEAKPPPSKSLDDDGDNPEKIIPFKKKKFGGSIRKKFDWPQSKYQLPLKICFQMKLRVTTLLLSYRNCLTYFDILFCLDMFWCLITRLGLFMSFGHGWYLGQPFLSIIILDDGLIGFYHLIFEKRFGFHFLFYLSSCRPCSLFISI